MLSVSLNFVSVAQTEVLIVLAQREGRKGPQIRVLTRGLSSTHAHDHTQPSWPDARETRSQLMTERGFGFSSHE